MNLFKISLVSAKVSSRLSFSGQQDSVWNGFKLWLNKLYCHHLPGEISAYIDCHKLKLFRVIKCVFWPFICENKLNLDCLHCETYLPVKVKKSQLPNKSSGKPNSQASFFINGGNEGAKLFTRKDSFIRIIVTVVVFWSGCESKKLMAWPSEFSEQNFSCIKPNNYFLPMLLRVNERLTFRRSEIYWWRGP